LSKRAHTATAARTDLRGLGKVDLRWSKYILVLIVVALLFQSLGLVVTRLMITRHHITCTTLELQRRHSNGDPFSRKPLHKRHKALHQLNHD